MSAELQSSFSLLEQKEMFAVMSLQISLELSSQHTQLNGTVNDKHFKK